jgi:O-antigen ligase
MAPQIALIICIGFVLFLLKIERKQSQEVSIAVWIPTLWMMLVSSKPLGVWFQLAGSTMEEGSPLDRVFLIAILCVGLMILIKRKFAWSGAIKENPWLVLLIGYILMSVLWSDMAYTSFKRTTRQLVAVIIPFLIATETAPRQAVQSVIRKTIYVFIPFSIILINFFGELGREYHKTTGELMWTGVASQKNGLGALCLIAAFFLIWSLITRRRRRDIFANRYQTHIDTAILFLTFYLMGGPKHSFTYSATSNATLILVLSVFFGISLMKKRGFVIGPAAFFVLVALLIAYGTATPFIGKLSLVDISSALGRNETLTGRSEIWEKLIPFAIERPILGHGFGGFWSTEMREFAFVGEAHNGYLDLVLNIGFLGLFLFAMFLLSCCRRAQREMIDNFDWGVFFICYILMTVVHNIAESTSVGFASEFSAVVLTLAVSHRKLSETIRTHHKGF